MIDSPNPRARRLVLLLLLAALSAPIAGTASNGAPCCPAMQSPCADGAPCASFAPAPCCHAAPAAAWPTAAPREAGQPAPAQLARSIPPAPALPMLAGAAARDFLAGSPSQHLSAVLRN